MKKYLILFPIIFHLSVSSAFACLCSGTPTVAEELKQATAIFSGKYTGAEYRKGIVDEFRKMEEQIDGKKVEYEVLVLKFEAQQWWKGSPAREVILITGVTRAADGMTSIPDCEIAFERGKLYLVYAYGKESELGTDGCSRTARLSKARADLRILGRGKKFKNGVFGF